jgi:hypothetical protein
VRGYVAVLVTAGAAGWAVLAGAGVAGAVPAATGEETGDSSVTVMSCASAGNCSAGGDFVGNSAGFFTVSEKNGVWARARLLPGTGFLEGDDSALTSMSCPSAGNCTAVGRFGDRSVFAVSEKDGRWRKWQTIPGTLSLPARKISMAAVSCPSPGNCGAFGTCRDRRHRLHGFVVSEIGGIWRRARGLPADVALTSLSCGSTGNCVAGGYSSSQAFVVTDRHGGWGRPSAVPGPPAGRHADPEIQAVSCTSAGNCGAGGSYTTRSGVQLFVLSKEKGTWQRAKQLPGIARLNKGMISDLTSISCRSAGDCDAGGYYADASGIFQAFVADERAGAWRDAQEVPGTAELNAGTGTGAAAGVDTVSCGSPGGCGAGGFYTDGSGDGQVFTDSEARGTWRTAREIPGTAALNSGGEAFFGALSCGSTGDCGAGGACADKFLNQQAFVVSETNGTRRKAIQVPGIAALER